ncbi:MAG: arylesterase [Gammaproteobacteria bacterium]|jgi:acyl-CoA thioesterase-1|nr:arylesterase [Gammaproteobacteria bacterium]
MRCASFFFLLTLWGSVAAAASAPTVLVLGDSLSAAYGIAQDRGWVALLQRRLADRGLPHRIVNASVSGETTRGGLTRLPRLLEEHRPDLVVIELGANDGLRGISDRVLADNLRALVETSTGSGARVLLLGIRLPPNYGAAFNARFDRVFDEVARETQTPLVPFFLKGVAEDRELMLPDGLHPAAEAQPTLLDNVWPALEPLLEATRKQTAPVSAPAATSG